MKTARRLLATLLVLCLAMGFAVPIQAAESTHTIVLSSTQNSDGSYAHTAIYDGAAVKEYDYTWHADPSTVHSDVNNSPAEYYTGTEPGNEAVYIAHDIYYYPELPTSGFTRQNYDGEQEWCYYYTAEGYTGYIFSTLPGRSSLPTQMMHSEEEAYKNAVLHITQPGTYTVRGTWHGQIWVDLENYCDDPFTDPTAKVELILNGVTIDCSVAAGVVFHNVYECDNTWEDQSSWSYKVDTSAAGAVVTLADGTVNNVTGTNIFRILKTQYKSGSTSVQKKRLKIDGGFYSYQSLNIQGGPKGTGILNITAGYEGLDSELHLTVNGGNVNIFSQDDGINVNEDNVSVVAVNGGTLHILAGLGSEGDGIDSNGFISVTGGTVITMANPGADSGMDSDKGTYVFGGNVIALGATMDWATNDSSVSYDQAIMNLQFSSSKSAGDAIILTDSNGKGIFAYDPDKDEVNGSTVRTYTGAIIASENMTIGSSYHVYIGGEVTGTETKGIYDMSTVTAVSNTYQQKYGSTGSSGSRPGRPGSSGGSSSTGGSTTFSLTNNVTKFSSVSNASGTTSITVTPGESNNPIPEEKTYYLFGYINGANYACEEDYENMGDYMFVDGKLVATFSQDSYIAVKEADNAAWYMTRSYCTDTTGTFYNTSTGASEKMFVPGNAEITFTLTENADGSLALSYTAVSLECSHSYTSSVTTAATCTTDGVRTYTCSKCGNSYTESIAATGHSYRATVITPTCTTGGYTSYKCSICGNSYTDNSTPATGHNYVNGTCTGCGAAEPICSHSYTSSVTTSATCTTDGVKTYTCSKCSNSYTESIAATGHNYANGACTSCGAADPNVSSGTAYYLVGYINGADHGCEGDWQNMGDYKFVNGKLTATFNQDSYVFIKTEDNGKWLLAESYCTDTTCTFSEGKSEKMFVPGHVEITFTLTENADGTVTLSYTTGSVSVSTVPTLTLKAPTLEFKDMITVNAFYTAENIEDVVEMGMITYSSQVSSWSVDTAENVIPGAAYDSASGRYYSSSQGIHAKYLGDAVYLAIYAKLNDGTYAYSKLASYSAVTYATNQLKNSTDTKLKQLVAAMLNYGAEAQLYFAHNTSTLANASLTAEQQALPTAYNSSMVSSVPAASATKQGSFANNQGFASRKPAISFEGAFCINYFFTPNYAPDHGITLYYWKAADFEAASVLTTANASGSINLEGSGTGEYRGDITGISAKAISDAVYVAAVYENGGTTWTSGVLGYSIGAYCSNQASSGSTIAGLAKATAVYGYHAKAYFDIA